MMCACKIPSVRVLTLAVFFYPHVTENSENEKPTSQTPLFGFFGFTVPNIAAASDHTGVHACVNDAGVCVGVEVRVDVCVDVCVWYVCGRVCGRVSQVCVGCMCWLCVGTYSSSTQRSQCHNLPIHTRVRILKRLGRYLLRSSLIVDIT